MPDSEAGIPPEDGGTAIRDGRRLHRGWLLVVLVCFGVLVWLAVVGGLAIAAQGPLEDGRAHMVEGRDLLLTGDVEQSSAQFSSARSSFRAAHRRLGGPVSVPAHHIPGFGRQLRTVSGISAAGALVAEAAIEVSEAMAQLPDGLGTLAPRGGAIPIDPLVELAPAVRRADELLARAEERFTDLPTQGLVSPVLEARTEFGLQLGEARTLSRTTAALVSIMPDFLGQDGVRRYFFGAVNPAELRGSGGFLGAATVLEIADGTLSFGEFESVPDLPVVHPDDLEPPNPDFVARYERYGAHGFFMNINMTPDFPSAAVAIERLYAEVRDMELDGTILADPFALQALMEVGGPVQIPGFGTVEAERVVEVVANEAYGVITDTGERKRLLGAIAAGAVSGLLQGDHDVPPAETAHAIVGAAAGGHLLFHSSDEAVQSAFLEAGVAGALEQGGGDAFMVVSNNTGANKADFYLDRHISYDVELLEGGDGRLRAGVSLTNNAPTQGEKYVIGPNADGAVPGDNLQALSVFFSGHARITEFLRAGEPDGTIGDQELGRVVHTVGVLLGSGESEELQFSGDLDDVWHRLPDGRGRYRLVLQDQTTIRPTSGTVRVRVPDGMVVTGIAGTATFEDDQTVEWSGTVGPREEIVVEFGD